MTSISPQGSTPDSSEQEIDAVRRRFSVSSEFRWENDVIEFNLEPIQTDMKAGFLSLIDELSLSAEPRSFVEVTKVSN